MTPALAALPVRDRGALHVRRTKLKWVVIAVLLVAFGGAAQAEWIDQSPPGVRALRVVHAVSAQVAWAAGIDGEILRTVDGGQTWEDVPNGADTSFRWALHAFDDQKCIVGNSTGLVHMTTNGGQDWDFVQGVVTFINGIHFFDESNGWLLADPRQGFFNIWTTSDGGWTWELDPNAPPADPGIEGLNGSYCWTDDQNGIFGTTDFIAWRTTNGGTIWNPVTTNVDRVHGLVLSETDGIGLAAGTVGKLDRSTDGGASWAPVTSPTPEFYIWSFDWVEGTNHVWGVTAGGAQPSQSRILQSVNAGLDWTQTVQSTGLNAFDISAAADSVVWVVGGDGTIADARIFKLEPDATTSVAGASTPPAPAGIRLAARPLPARSSVTVNFHLLRATQVDIEIFDARGRNVRSLRSGDLPAGEHTFDWDLVDARGQRVARGVYLARVRYGGGAETLKITVD